MLNTLMLTDRKTAYKQHKYRVEWKDGETKIAQDASSYRLAEMLARDKPDAVILTIAA